MDFYLFKGYHVKISASLLLNHIPWQQVRVCLWSRVSTGEWQAAVSHCVYECVSRLARHRWIMCTLTLLQNFLLQSFPGKLSQFQALLTPSLLSPPSVIWAYMLRSRCVKTKPKKVKSPYHCESLTRRLTDNFPMVNLQRSVCLSQQKAGTRAAPLTQLNFKTHIFFSQSTFSCHTSCNINWFGQYDCVCLRDLLRHHRLFSHILQEADPL